MKPFPLLPAVACFLAAGLFGPAPSRAADDDQEAHKAAAEEVLKAMHMDTTFAATTDRMMLGVDRFIDSAVQKSTDKAAAAEFQTRMHAQTREMVKKQFTWDAIKPAFVQSYEGSFSTQELKELATFYNTPVGQKLVAKQPEVAERTSKAGQERVQQVLPPIIRMVQAEAAKLPGNNAPMPGAPGAVPGQGAFPVPPPPPPGLGRPPMPPMPPGAVPPAPPAPPAASATPAAASPTPAP